MFKLRLLAVLVMLPLVIAAILWLPAFYVAVASAIVFALAAIEWLHMIGIKTMAMRLILVFLLMLVSYSLLLIGISAESIYCLAVLWWALGFVGICYYPRGAEIWKHILLQPFVGLIMFLPAWLAFNQLYTIPHGPIWVLLGCSLIWGADIGAYCFGKLWGQTKLLEKVSPGKTWVGFYGGMFTSCLLMTIFYFSFKPAFNFTYAIWLALITVIFAVIGDLVESLLKRVYGFKDSGNLIPGHGGVYDRLDSMLAAFPVYVLGLQILLNLRIMIH